jgi:hypothetical protein
MYAICCIVHDVGVTYMCVCVDGMANMLCNFKNNNAIYVVYMVMRHACIVKLMYTCYEIDEHAFNAMNCMI